MGTIVISANVTLDGVGQDPTGEQGLPFGGWFSRISDADRTAWSEVETAEAVDAAALLMGRRSYEYFASRWLSRTGEWADRLNSMLKYVISSTLVDPEWENTTVLTGDIVNEVAKLKQHVDGEIVVNASFELGHLLLAQDLVDEIRLIAYPFVAGDGVRVLGRVDGVRAMRLVEVSRVGENLVYLQYVTVD